jgi:hypothetical protein
VENGSVLFFRYEVECSQTPGSRRNNKVAGELSVVEVTVGSYY